MIDPFATEIMVLVYGRMIQSVEGKCSQTGDQTRGSLYMQGVLSLSYPAGLVGGIINSNIIQL